MSAPAWLAYATVYQDIELLPIDGNPSDERMLEGDEKVVLYTDHLAALERVRVEALREERAAIMALRAFIVGKTALRDWDINEVVKGFDDAVAAIDRLINATTKGATDD